MAKKHAKHGSHMHDFEAHVRAVEEDLEYYRTKRFEPRVIYYARRGVVTFYDLLKVHSAKKPTAKTPKGHRDIEARVRAVEDGLDEYVRGIGLTSSAPIKGIEMVIEDTRKERGDYDEFFRITKREHPGTLEKRLSQLERDLQDCKMLLDAFTEALLRKGLDKKEFKRKRDALSEKKAWSGGRIVARAWVDPEFKANLIARGREAVRELEIPPGRLGKLSVMENTESIQNVVVCTLCSCYPHDLLGDTPWWYKHDSYKQRIVRDPRGTLAEMFRFQIPTQVEIRVHDSTSDVRYMVLPKRPPETEGMSEEDLARLVTIDSLIGVSEARHPSIRKEAETSKGGRSVYA